MSDVTHTPEDLATLTAPAFTEKQLRAWYERVVPIAEAHYLPQVASYWTERWADEQRPGRGHDYEASFVDGEHFAQVFIDVYGRANVSVADLDWVHSDSDEERDCDVCGECHQCGLTPASCVSSRIKCCPDCTHTKQQIEDECERRNPDGLS